MASERTPLMDAAIHTGNRLPGQGRQATVTLALLFASLILSYADRAVFALSLRTDQGRVGSERLAARVVERPRLRGQLRRVQPTRGLAR